MGLTVSIGALQAAFADWQGAYREWARAMVLVGLAGALSVVAGRVAGGTPWLVIALTALWGFVAGIVVALGPIATQIGPASTVLLIVFTAQPATPAYAAESAACGRRPARS